MEAFRLRNLIRLIERGNGSVGLTGPLLGAVYFRTVVRGRRVVDAPKKGPPRAVRDDAARIGRGDGLSRYQPRSEREREVEGEVAGGRFLVARGLEAVADEAEPGRCAGAIRSVDLLQGARFRPVTGRLLALPLLGGSATRVQDGLVDHLFPAGRHIFRIVLGHR